MRLKISQIIFVFTLLFAFDISADKKIPPLEKDLYLKGSNLFFNDLSERYYGYDLLIRLFNDYDKETRRILERCDVDYKRRIRDYSKEFAESSKSPECLLDYEKTVASDIYFYLTDELKLNRNRFLKAFTCETEYDGDGNEFIEIDYYEYACTKVEGELELETYRRIIIQRSNLLTRFSVRFERDRVEINNVEFIDEEEYKKLYQQIDDKHKAYMKKIEEESLI
tara:strand:+ start:147 stop:818 length:672 start_codon:yes stop_codon:yes gene_type:complete